MIGVTQKEAGLQSAPFVKIPLAFFFYSTSQRATATILKSDRHDGRAMTASERPWEAYGMSDSIGAQGTTPTSSMAAQPLTPSSFRLGPPDVPFYACRNSLSVLSSYFQSLNWILPISVFNDAHFSVRWYTFSPTWGKFNEFFQFRVATRSGIEQSDRNKQDRLRTRSQPSRDGCRVTSMAGWRRAKSKVCLCKARRKTQQFDLTVKILFSFLFFFLFLFLFSRFQNKILPVLSNIFDAKEFLWD